MRIKWIDVARGIGLLLVIFGHLVIWGEPVFNWIYSFHMPLFFFLSGYLLKPELKNAKLFLKKISLALIIPYFIFVIIGLIVSLIVSGWQPISYNTVFFDVFYAVQPESLHVGQIWFLICLAIVQILFFIFLKLRIKNTLFKIIIISSFALIAYLIHEYKIGLWIDGIQYRLPFKLDTAFMGLFFFAIGYYVKYFKIFSKIFCKKPTDNFYFMIIALEVNIFFGLYLNKTVNMGDNVYNNILFFIVAALAGIIFIIYLSYFLEKNRLLLYMGSNTLSIFSSHSFILFLYTYLISIIFGTSYVHLINIPLELCIIGVLFIGTITLLVPIIYNNTIQKLIIKLKY